MKLLLNDFYDRDREMSRKAFGQIEQRTHTLQILDDTVTLQCFERLKLGAAAVGGKLHCDSCIYS